MGFELVQITDRPFGRAGHHQAVGLQRFGNTAGTGTGRPGFGPFGFHLAAAFGQFFSRELDVDGPLVNIVDADLVILYPEEVCPTGKVYTELSRDLTYAPRNCYLFHDLPEQPGSTELAPLIFNRLQESALRVSGKLNQAWSETAHEPDVLVRFVSGSGSSIVFLVSGTADAQRLVQSLTARALGRAFAVKSLPRGEVWG